MFSEGSKGDIEKKRIKTDLPENASITKSSK